ncbi:MAG TPA: hypothetical protein VIN33_04555, partial [Marinobacter sp.]
MSFVSSFRVVPAASVLFYLCTASMTAAAENQPQSEKNFSTATPEQCALIRDGIQRLACHDAINDPAEAREQAAEDELDAASDSIEALEYEELADAE